MRKIKKRIIYKDERGLIIDLLERKKINAITYIMEKNYVNLTLPSRILGNQ